MEVARAIRYGNTEALLYNEHQILYEIESRINDTSINIEDYMTFWIASHKDLKVATEMYEIFKNTCEIAFSLKDSEDILTLYAWATLAGAIGTQNIDILDYIMGYISKEMVYEEMNIQYGEKEEWPIPLLNWFDSML